MPDLSMSGAPRPHEVAAILVALRVAARPAAMPERASRRRPVVLAHVSGGRAWRLAPAVAV